MKSIDESIDENETSTQLELAKCLFLNGTRDET